MKVITILIVTATVSALVLTGCSKESASPSAPSFDLAQFELSPNDGATAVRLDAAIVLWFAKPVDRGLVERGFHLISEKAMADSLCPVSRTMNHGSMSGSMPDTSKMRHLEQFHATRGRFSWNSDSTLCTFKPDSMMVPKTQYMMHLDGDVMHMMQSRLGSMNMTPGHGAGSMSGEMMFHFSTLDITQQGSGHDGHH
ncbi:MAG: hypothetical protein Q8P51_15410 [Ignavibacteria bacterium]|nr:hypothetical protein [Ignavibacteria bacterium]